MSTKYGFKGKIYLNTGTYGTPVWSELTQCKDVKVNAEFGEFDTSIRLGGGIEMSEPVLLKLGLDGMVKSDEADTNGFLLMETSTLTRAAMDVLILDASNATNGARGYRVDMKNFKFPEDQGNDKILFREFSLKPCLSVNAPSKAVVASASPVFSTLVA